MSTDTLIAVIPTAWQANPKDGTPDNMVLGDNEDAYLREATPSGVRYGNAEEWGEGLVTYLPPSMTNNGRDELTPDQVRERFAELESYARPRVENAFEQGRRRGRAEIKGVLRDLVGPETAANVEAPFN